MALLFEMGTGNGGSDIKPFIVEFTASDNDYNGQTVTMKYLGTPHAGEVVSDVSGTIVNRRLTLYPMHDGEWSITSETVSGKPFSNKITLDKWDEYAVTLISGLNVAEWLNRGRWTGTQYTTLANILADEKCVRQLMTVHDSVDYLVTELSIDTDAAQTILDNDICAKWINLRDYALDMLYANQTVKAVMDKVDKYGYGEWALINGTWQPKGAVPVMTSNTAPYGEVIHSNVAVYISNNFYDNLSYYIFNNDQSIDQSVLPYVENANFEIGYKFVNPISVRRIEITGSAHGKDYAGKIMAYINNDWVELCELTFRKDIEDKKKIKLDTPTAYATEIKFVSTIPKTPYTGFNMRNFQIYGRTLNVSVPKMDNYTTPFGEVIELGYVAGGYEGYRAFDNDLSTYWQSNTDYTGMICYNFEKEVLVKNMYSIMKTPNTGVSKLEGSNTGNSNDWHSIYSDNITAGYPNTKSVLINGNLTYKYYRATITRTDDVPQVTELQFYGLDYSEKEFAQDGKVEYIYDHDIELMALTKTSSSALVTFDTTNCKTLRATLGKYATTSDKIQCGSANATLNGNPFSLGLDITNVNGNNATGFGNINVANMGDTSLWVENK